MFAQRAGWVDAFIQPVQEQYLVFILLVGDLGTLESYSVIVNEVHHPGTEQIAREFHVGNQVAVLGTTLFLFSFGLDG